MTHICNLGLIHDKPCPDGKPSSNNGWIYSAIAESVGMKFSRTELLKTFNDCVVVVQTGFILINRLPGKQEPPLSHDEIIGMYLLDMIDYRTLKDNHFVYHGPGKPMNMDTIKLTLLGLVKLFIVSKFVGKFHRNLFWEHKIIEMNQIAFRLNPAYAYFLKLDNGIEPHLEEKLIWDIHVQATLESGSNGSKNILYAMAKRIGLEKLQEKINHKKSMGLYFTSDHPIIHQIKSNEL